MGGVVGAILPAVAGPIIGGLFGQSASDTQAQGATDAATTAANAQIAGLNFIQQQEAPYNQAGQQALGRYEQLLGLSPASGTIGSGPGGQSPNFGPAGSPAGQKPLTSAGTTPGGFDINSYLSNLPGYQFELGQGQNAIQNSAAARGQALSGNTLQGLEQFGQGLASTQFQQYMSQLAGLTGVGQAAASGVATAGGNLIPGAGASLASGINNAAGYNASNTANWGNMFQTAFNAPSVQSGLTSGINSLFGQQSLGGVPSDASYAANNWLTS